MDSINPIIALIPQLMTYALLIMAFTMIWLHDRKLRAARQFCLYLLTMSLSLLMIMIWPTAGSGLSMLANTLALLSLIMLLHALRTYSRINISLKNFYLGQGLIFVLLSAAHLTSASRFGNYWLILFVYPALWLGVCAYKIAFEKVVRNNADYFVSTFVLLVALIVTIRGIATLSLAMGVPVAQFSIESRNLIVLSLPFFSTGICLFVIISLVLSGLSKLTQLATTDAMTGLLRREVFHRRSMQVWKTLRRYNRGFALVFVDIDFFKKVNDSCGHAAGDKVIGVVAETIRNSTRSMDICGRLGGEEFAVVLPETSNLGASIFADRLRKAVEEQTVKYKDKEIQVTLSLGVCTTDSSEPASLKNMFELADKALYEAKQSGRNRVCFYPSNELEIPMQA